MRRWERRLTWFSYVVGTAGALMMLTLWGPLSVALIGQTLQMGPAMIVQEFGRAIAGCILAGFALTLPAWIVAFATYPERRQRRLALREQRARRDWYTRWRDWTNGLFRILHPALHQQAQKLILLAPTITRESLQEYLRDVKRASYREYAFWGGVLLCLGLGVLGEYRLPLHGVPGAQMALAAAIAVSFIFSACALATYLRWLAVRNWRRSARRPI